VTQEASHDREETTTRRSDRHRAHSSGGRWCAGDAGGPEDKRDRQRPDMTQLHEQMTGDDPDMARLHERMMGSAASFDNPDDVASCR
jgi:hypothetical protein